MGSQQKKLATFELNSCRTSFPSSTFSHFRRRCRENQIVPQEKEAPVAIQAASNDCASKNIM